MIDDVCTLTIGDFSTLRALEEHWSENDHALLPDLRRKLDSARVVFQDDLPRGVATLGSRIAYTVDRGELETRALTCLAGVGEQWLPIRLPVGLAILGRSEGQDINVREGGGAQRLVRLHRVFDQPEANWPERFEPEPKPAQPALRLVQGGGRRAAAVIAAPDDGDDPGPSAA